MNSSPKEDSGFRFATHKAAEGALAEALEVIAHIVSQANVNPVEAEDKHGSYIARYDMPVGSIHKAIPFLARFGIVVDRYGFVHRADRRQATEARDGLTGPERVREAIRKDRGGDAPTTPQGFA